MPNNNTYGIVRQALINPSQDAVIYYHYRPSRNVITPEYSKFTKLDNVSEMLSCSEVDTTESDTRLPGMYTLKMPTRIFNKKGIYTVYIVPKEIRCTIKDVGSLAAYPGVRGIILDYNSLPSDADRELFKNDGLVGYRVEYYEYEDGLKRQDYYRIVTSNNLCSPVSQNLTSTNTNTNGYRFSQSGSLVFITLTPSTNPEFKGNAMPYIGCPNQTVSFVNTKFDPVCVEIEMTEHDIETVSYMLEGEQVRNYETGTVTTYNFEGEPYKQFEFSTIKDNYTKNNIAEAKLSRDNNFDDSLPLDQIKNS